MNTNQPSRSLALPSWKTSALWGLGVGLFALALRAPAMGESLWVDELHTAWVVSDAVAEVPQRGAMGNQASLYFYIIWIWTQLTGLHEWSLRLPSLVGGSLAVGLVTFMAHRWTHDAWVGLAAGLVAAIDIDWIFFATEARTYGLVQVVALVQVVLALSVLEENRQRDWILLVAATLVGFYLHYSTILFSGCLALAILMLAHDRPTRLRLLIAAGCVALGASVSLPHLLRIFERRENWASFISATSVQEWTRWGTALACLLPAALAALCCWPKWSQEGKRTVLLALVVLLPVGVAWLTTATGVAALFFGRYLISSETLMPWLLASLAALVPMAWWRRGAVVVAVIIAFGLRTPTYLGPMRGEDWRTITQAVSAKLEADSEPTDVLIASGLIESDILRSESQFPPIWETYARLPIESIYSLPQHDGQNFGLTYSSPGQATPRYREEANPENRVVLIVRGTEKTTDQVVQNFLDSIPDHTYEVTTPEPQTARVQWRVLEP